MAREVGSEGGGGPDTSPQFETYTQSRDPNDRANLPGNRPAASTTPWTPQSGRDYYTMPEEIKAWTAGAGAALSGFGNAARGVINFVGDTLQSSVWDATHPFASREERERRTTTRIEGGGNPRDWYRKRGKTTLGQQVSDAAAVALALGAPEAAVVKAGIQLKNAKTAANAVRDLKKTEDIVKAVTQAPVKTVGSGTTGVVTARGRTVRGEGLPNLRGASAAAAGAGKGDGTGKGTGTGKGDGAGRGTGTGKGSGTGKGTGQGTSRGEGPEGKPSTGGGTATMERPRDFTPPAKEKLKPVPGFGGPSGTGGTPELAEDIKLGLGTTEEPKSIQFNQPTPVTVPTSTTRPTSATQPTVSSIPKTETKASTTNPTTTPTKTATSGGGGGGGGGGGRKPKKRFTGTTTSFSGSEQEIRRTY